MKERSGEGRIRAARSATKGEKGTEDDEGEKEQQHQERGKDDMRLRFRGL